MASIVFFIHAAQCCLCGQQCLASSQGGLFWGKKRLQIFKRCTRGEGGRIACVLAHVHTLHAPQQGLVQHSSQQHVHNKKAA